MSTKYRNFSLYTAITACPMQNIPIMAGFGTLHMWCVHVGPGILSKRVKRKKKLKMAAIDFQCGGYRGDRQLIACPTHKMLGYHLKVNAQFSSVFYHHLAKGDKTKVGCTNNGKS